MTARLEIFAGDITGLEVDAIVNAANSHLIPGGGVDGAINRAAGPDLARAMAALGGCPTGEARITEAFRLPARYVIHAVGPVWHGGGKGEDALLEGAYRSALELARDRDLESIAFPAISTGVYRFPLARAAAIAVGVGRSWIDAGRPPSRIVYCVFGAEAETAYRREIGGTIR